MKTPEELFVQFPRIVFPSDAEQLRFLPSFDVRREHDLSLSHMAPVGQVLQVSAVTSWLVSRLGMG